MIVIYNIRDTGHVCLVICVICDKILFIDNIQLHIYIICIKMQKYA
jgi:hypothetical protein